MARTRASKGQGRQGIETGTAPPCPGASGGDGAKALPRWALPAAILGLLLITFAAFSPAVGFGFLSLGDPSYTTGNPHIRTGLTWDGVRWAFLTREIGFPMPITFLSHMADCQVFGLRPWGHHLTSILIHALSAVLLLLALNRMTGALWPSAFVAALFAVHPLHAEPVAWLADRKDVLCGFFWVATLLAYSRYAPRPAPARYLAVLACALLAMLSKPMAVTLPFALLLLDLWPLGRWPGDLRGPGQRATLSRLLLEKVPMLLPIPLISLATLSAQTDYGALASTTTFPLGERVSNALYAYAAYLGKTFVPVRLAAMYPFDHAAMPLWKPLLGAAVLLCGTAAALLLFRAKRYVTSGWFWYIGTLVPVIGLVHAGSQSMADRYTYIPLLGVFLIFAWGATEALAGASRGRQAGAAAFAVLLVLLLAVRTRAQVMTWRDEEALYTQVIRVSPKAILAYTNLGTYYLQVKGEPQKALECYEKALSVDPGYGDVQLNMGLVLGRMGRAGEAVPHLQEAARLEPDRVQARLALGAAYLKSGNPAKAAETFGGCIARWPGEWKAYTGLGESLSRSGKVREALPVFERAAALFRDNPEILRDLGMAYGETAAWPKAASALGRAAELVPKDGSAWALAGYAQVMSGNRAEGMRSFERALALDPSLPQPHYYLGLAAAESGNPALAKRHAEALRSSAPGMAQAIDEKIAAAPGGAAHGVSP
jgi:protein O-mannosyl-transferase